MPLFSIHSTIPLLPKSEISSMGCTARFVLVRAGPENMSEVNLNPPNLLSVGTKLGLCLT